MSVSSYALVSLAELQTYRGIPNPGTAAEQTSLEELIDAATKAIESRCQNGFVNRSYTEDYYWWQIGGWSRDKSVIRLKQYPIVSVTSITDQDSPANTVASTDYWLEKRLGRLIRPGGWTIPQDSNGFATYWPIIYTSGRYAATANVDDDLKLACKVQVAAMWNRPDKSVRRKRVDSLELEWGASENETGELVPEAVSLIQPYISRIG